MQIGRYCLFSALYGLCSMMLIDIDIEDLYLTVVHVLR